MAAEGHSYTAWANVRLACFDCQAEDILKDILEGPRLKVLLHSEQYALFKKINFTFFYMQLPIRMFFVYFYQLTCIEK